VCGDTTFKLYKLLGNAMKKICAPRDTRGRIIYRTKNPNYCYKTLPIEKFEWKNKSKGLRYHNCSSCRYKYEMKRYDKNPEAKQRRAARALVYARPYMRARRAHLRSIINEIKLNSGCVDCKGTFHPSIMHFDHVRGTKKYGISEMVGRRMPLDTILKEIEKCDVRCAPCHRTRHKNERATINNPEM